MMEFDNYLLERLLEQAGENPRLRQSIDLRTSSADAGIVAIDFCKAWSG